MKSIKTIFIIALSISYLMSCNRDLNIVQNSQLSASNMWTEASDIKAAVFGSYVYLRTAFKTNILYWGEYRNGLWGPGTNGTLHDKNMNEVGTSTMTNGNSHAAWTDLYTTINMANLVLKYVPEMNISDQEKEYGLAHAYFIRAYCYFWIVRIWGDAPLALQGFESTSQELELSRVSEDSILAQIDEDLENASKYKDNFGNDKSIATTEALAMLKADFGLWMYSVKHGGSSYLTNVESALQDLDMSPTKLEKSFSDIFSSENKLGTEIIMSISQENGESTGGFMGEQNWNRSYVASSFADNPVPIYNNQWWVYTDDYISIITEESADQRSGVSYGHGPYGTNGSEIGWANKYAGQVISGTRVFDSDIVLYRFAQAYLFDAELKYYQERYDEALESLNVIANRAYGIPDFYTNPSQNEVLTALVKENLKEFASEGNTWWTLIRLDVVWDYNASLASQRTKTNILLWPITQSIINRDANLKQTLGWD